MEYMFIGGSKSGETSSTGPSTTGRPIVSNLLFLTPLIISLIFIIISLATIPGTAAYKTKYVKKDDPNSELGLRDIKVPVILLSFTLLILLITGALYWSNSRDISIKN
jgi:hypothetical protein